MPPPADPRRPPDAPTPPDGESDDVRAAVDALARLLVDDYLRAPPRGR